MTKVDYYNLFFHYIKMSEKTLCQRNRDVILNRAKDYYKNDKNRLKEQERNKYRELLINCLLEWYK